MHQHGFHVERRFGWDTHGLPVEYEIDKTLNIKGPEDVAKMGIAAYNAECRKIVMRCVSANSLLLIGFEVLIGLVLQVLQGVGGHHGTHGPVD